MTQRWTRNTYYMVQSCLWVNWLKDICGNLIELMKLILNVNSTRYMSIQVNLLNSGIPAHSDVSLYFEEFCVLQHCQKKYIDFGFKVGMCIVVLNYVFTYYIYIYILY